LILGTLYFNSRIFLVNPFAISTTQNVEIAASPQVDPFQKTLNIKLNRSLSSQVVFIVARYNEDISWLALNFPDIPHLVYQKSEDSTTCNGAPLCSYPNVGAEAPAYLQYILDFYETLPNVTVFLHGHQSAWHESNIVQKLNRIRFERVKFFNVGENTMCVNLTREDDIQSVTTAQGWDEFMADEFGPMPEQVCSPCCAQFAVSRDRIRLRSKSFYRRLMKWITTTSMRTFYSSRVFEYLWHILFGEEPVIDHHNNHYYLYPS
jgi:uncharacterized protein YifN (PemK superfamily)